jgi:5'-3' exonuclease
MPLVSNPAYADVFVLFDVHNLVGRCEGGPMGTLTNSQNYPTNAIDIGLSKIRAAANYAGLDKGKRVCLVFSAQESRSVRAAHYPEYKANRPTKAKLVLPVTWHDGSERDIEYNGVRDLMELMQYIPSCTITMPENNGETDDAIASFVHRANKPCIVVTEDRDMWALMSPRVTIISKPEKPYGISNLEEKFGITEPGKLALAKVLYGDDSDNVFKAVKGVTPRVVGEALTRCNKLPGEKQYAFGFFRELEDRRAEKIISALFAKQTDIAFMERWIRLRPVRLVQRYSSRDIQSLDRLLTWYGVNKKKQSFITFAQS